MITLQRLTEHLISAFFSIQAARSFDSSTIVTLGCIAAISDAVMRKVAITHPSEVSCHLIGRNSDGRQLGHTGFGVSINCFIKQVNFDFILKEKLHN
jgi:hypothetical protein